MFYIATSASSPLRKCDADVYQNISFTDFYYDTATTTLEIKWDSQLRTNYTLKYLPLNATATDLEFLTPIMKYSIQPNESLQYYFTLNGSETSLGYCVEYNFSSPITSKLSGLYAHNFRITHLHAQSMNLYALILMTLITASATLHHNIKKHEYIEIFIVSLLYQGQIAMAVKDHNKNDIYCVYNMNLMTCTVDGMESYNVHISEGLYGISAIEFENCVIDDSENKTCFNFSERQKSIVLLGFCEEVPLPPVYSMCNGQQRRLLWRIYIPFDGKYIHIYKTQ